MTMSFSYGMPDSSEAAPDSWGASCTSIYMMVHWSIAHSFDHRIFTAVSCNSCGNFDSHVMRIIPVLHENMCNQLQLGLSITFFKFYKQVLILALASCISTSASC